MTNVTRASIFQSAARQMRQEFAALGVVPHRGLKGDEAVRLVRTFLNNHLPKRFAASSGFIIDHSDNVSRQTDVVIYDALNCPVYRASAEAAIFPADNVAAVIEVKSSLNGQRFRESVENIRAAKPLGKTAPPQRFGPLQTHTLGCVVAFDAVSPETLEDYYVESLLQKDALGHHIDTILVLDKCVMSLAAHHPRFGYWGTASIDGIGGHDAEGSHFAVGTQLLGDESLDAFLRLLLGHLMRFRHIVDNPWRQERLKLRYLLSYTTQTDPVRRAKVLRRYEVQAREQIVRYSRPGSEDKG